MKKVLYIGNRPGCYKVLENNPQYDIVKLLVKKGSFLESYLCKNPAKYEVFTNEDKKEVFEQIHNCNYDILVSNGCPFIIKASQLIEQGKILLNTHPTYLPHLRGSTPLNGVFYNGYDFIGATTHYISDGIDSGNVIYQKKLNLTPDIDQGLVYFISFNLETEVFQEALRLLENSNYKFLGTPIDINEGCYFNRTKEKQTIDFNTDDTDLIVRKIKSFGIPSQGVIANIDGHYNILYQGEKITNNYLLEYFSNFSVGSVALRYEDCMIVKTNDGLIKISKFKEIAEKK